MATVIKNEVELARARLNGFVDAVSLLEECALTFDELRGVIKAYQTIWLRHYLVEAGKQECVTSIGASNDQLYSKE